VAAGQIFQAVYVLQLMDSVLLPGDCVDAVPSAAAVECRSEFVRAGGAAAVHGFFVALGPPSPWRAPLGGLPDPLSHAVRMALGLCLKVLMVCLQVRALSLPLPSPPSLRIITDANLRPASDRSVHIETGPHPGSVERP
jgi:hypothetical protein